MPTVKPSSFRCDNCGALIDKITDAEKVVCAYCGTKYDVYTDDGQPTILEDLGEESSAAENEKVEKHQPLLRIEILEFKGVLWMAIFLYVGIILIGWSLSKVPGAGTVLLVPLSIWFLISIIGRFFSNAPQWMRNIGRWSLKNVFPMGLIWALLVISGAVAFIMRSQEPGAPEKQPGLAVTVTPSIPMAPGNTVLIQCADGETTQIREKCKETNTGKFFNFSGLVEEVSSNKEIKVKISVGNYAVVTSDRDIASGLGEGQVVEFFGMLENPGTGIMVSHKITKAQLGHASAAQLDAEEAKKPSIPEFVTERKAACQAYKAENNPIKQDQIFETYFKRVKRGIPIKSEIAEVDTISTNSDGEAYLEIETHYGSIAHRKKIGKKDKLYKIIAELNKGDKVTFNGKLFPQQDVIPFGGRKQSILCSLAGVN